jgi:tape measure domain-containing protein
MALSVGTLFASLRVDMGQFLAGMRTSRQELDKLSKQAKRDFESIASSAKLWLGIAAAAMAALATGAIAAGIEFNALGEQSQVAFETLLGSAEAANQMIKDLQKTARDTPYEFVGLQNSAKLLLAMGFAANQIQPALLVLGDAVAAIGGNEETLKGVTLAIGQMLTKGKISAEEMNQLAERGIAAWDLMSESLGKSKAELMKMAENGKFLASEGLPALLEGLQKRYAGAMEEQSKTFIGMTNILKDSLTITLGDLTKSLFGGLVDDMGLLIKRFDELRASGDLSRWAEDMGDKISDAYETIKEFALGAIDFAKGVKDNWSTIAPVVAAVVAGFISMKVIGTITKLWGAYKVAVAGATLAQGSFLAVIGPVRIAFMAIATLAGIAAFQTGAYADAADRAARESFVFAQSLTELNEKLRENPLERSSLEVSELETDIKTVNELLVQQADLQEKVARAAANMSKGLDIQGNKEGDTVKLAKSFGELNKELKNVNDKLAVFNITTQKTGQEVLNKMNAALGNSVNGILELRQAEITELGVKNQQVIANQQLRDRYFELTAAEKLNADQKRELNDVVMQLLNQYPSLQVARDLEGRMIIHNTEVLRSRISTDKEWVKNASEGLKAYLQNLRTTTTAQAEQIRTQINNLLNLAKAHKALANEEKEVITAQTDPRFRGNVRTDNSAFQSTADRLNNLNERFPSVSPTIEEALKAEKLKELNEQLNQTDVALNNIDKALAEIEGGGAKTNPFDGLGADSGGLGDIPKAEDVASKVEKEVEDPRKIAFEEEIRRIEYEASMYDWSANQKIAAYQKVLTAHKSYLDENLSDERDILLQIKGLTDQVYREGYESSVRWIDERKYYNQLGLEEELAAWKRMSLRYKSGSEERIAIDREVYRVQKEIHEKRIADLEAEADKAVDAAEKQLSELNDALDAAADEVNDRSDARIESLRDQIKQVNDELQRQLDLYNEQIKALDKLVEQEDRAKETDKFNERVKALQDQIAWYTEQGADKFASEIASLERQIRDERESWGEQLRDWEIEDQKNAIRDAIDAANQAADDKVDGIDKEIAAEEERRKQELAEIERRRREAQEAFDKAQRDMEELLVRQQEVAAQTSGLNLGNVAPQSAAQKSAANSSGQMTKAITDAIKESSLKSVTVVTQIDSEKVAEKTIPIIGSTMSQPIRSF